MGYYHHSPFSLYLKPSSDLLCFALLCYFSPLPRLTFLTFPCPSFLRPFLSSFPHAFLLFLLTVAEAGVVAPSHRGGERSRERDRNAKNGSAKKGGVSVSDGRGRSSAKKANRSPSPAPSKVFSPSNKDPSNIIGLSSRHYGRYHLRLPQYHLKILFSPSCPPAVFSCAFFSHFSRKKSNWTNQATTVAKKGV